ncbi:unnamed protein product [Pleuronectes platessa]|uniref:Uncharacterized protein n=1 Tax=Pleuronectes platessa TaxID=8262 RepID=A0A9N7VIB7_PLEPL|nr:unnamed protein product [Pleuronectes platessa]
MSGCLCCCIPQQQHTPAQHHPYTVWLVEETLEPEAAAALYLLPLNSLRTQNILIVWAEEPPECGQLSCCLCSRIFTTGRGQEEEHAVSSPTPEEHLAQSSSHHEDNRSQQSPDAPSSALRSALCLRTSAVK